MRFTLSHLPEHFISLHDLEYANYTLDIIVSLSGIKEVPKEEIGNLIHQTPKVYVDSLTPSTKKEFSGCISEKHVLVFLLLRHIIDGHTLKRRFNLVHVFKKDAVSSAGSKTKASCRTVWWKFMAVGKQPGKH